jgi:hypothetical protein
MGIGGFIQGQVSARSTLFIFVKGGAIRMVLGEWWERAGGLHWDFPPRLVP